MNQKSYLKLLLYVSKLRFNQYPAYYYPTYMVVKCLMDFQFKFHVRQLDFLLRSIPNRYFDFLCRDHDILSDHTIFINKEVFDYYIFQKDVNFLNLNLSDAMKKSKKLSEAENVVKKILSSPENGNNKKRRRDFSSSSTRKMTDTWRS